MRTRPIVSPFVLALCLALPGLALGAGEAPAPSMGANVSDLKLGPNPVMPDCTLLAVQHGDPSQGPSFIYGSAKTGCKFPWHWHTPNEHVMLVTGSARMDMKEGGTLTLTAGGFAFMPSKHVHRFECLKDCTLYVYSDAAFDMHYVDADGKELTPAEALGKVGEKPGVPPAPAPK